MKAWVWCTLLLAVTAFGQPARRDVIIARLNADLIPLAKVARNQVMAQFANDLNGLYRPKGFATRNLAFALASVLAGRALSNDLLTPLTPAILDMASSAAVCQGNSSNLLQSQQFRASLEQAHNALIALNVSVPDTRRTMGSLYQAADRIARPLVVPIPPADPLVP